MATKYWYRGPGGTAAWDSQSAAPNYDNWWDDEAHTVPATALPTDDDGIILLGDTAPSDGPPDPIEVILFDSTGLQDDLSAPVTIEMGIADGGVLRVGHPGNQQFWAGQAGIGNVSCDFYSGAVVTGASINARFHDDSKQDGGELFGSPKFFGSNVITPEEAPLGIGTTTIYIFGQVAIVQTVNSITWEGNDIQLCALGSELSISGSITLTPDAITVENHLDQGVAVKNG